MTDGVKMTCENEKRLKWRKQWKKINKMIFKRKLKSPKSKYTFEISWQMVQKIFLDLVRQQLVMEIQDMFM